MLIQKEDYLGFLKATGVIERNYSFDAKSFQITLNCNLYSCFLILEDLLILEKSHKIEKMGRIIILRVKNNCKIGFLKYEQNQLIKCCPF